MIVLSYREYPGTRYFSRARAHDWTSEIEEILKIIKFLKWFRVLQHLVHGQPAYALAPATSALLPYPSVAWYRYQTAAAHATDEWPGTRSPLPDTRPLEPVKQQKQGFNRWICEVTSARKTQEKRNGTREKQAKVVCH